MADTVRLEAGRLPSGVAVSIPEGGSPEAFPNARPDDSVMGVVLLDSRLRIFGFTPAAGALLQLRPPDVGGPADRIFRRLDGARFEAELRTVLDGGPPTLRVVTTGDGGRLKVAFLPLLGQPAGVVVAVTGVGDSARPEQEPVERAWRDVDETVAIVAHDLREPLRTIRGFCHILEQRSGERLDAEGRSCLARIGAAAQRTRVLIDGLVRVSRVCATPFEGRPADMNALVDGVVSELRETIAACGGQVTRGQLPTVWGSAALLQQLVRNLVENALEYQSAAAPRVEITAARSGAAWRFAVRDNGKGIAQEHHARIFELFRRLDPARSPGRSGVGLTIAKRVVERHGGRIWVDSAPSGGSTFYFTLAAAGRDEG